MCPLNFPLEHGQIQAELFNIRIPQHDTKFIPFFSPVHFSCGRISKAHKYVADGNLHSSAPGGLTELVDVN